MHQLAEFRVTLAGGGQFYASWPRNACGRELRAAGAMLQPLTEWWADKLEAQAAGEAEYASWTPGVAIPLKGQQ